jgi:hypothetical protein
METAYLHLVTNHIPIIGVPFGLAVLLIGLWRSSDEIKSAALAIFVFLGVATVGVYLLGQSGEDFVEDLAGVSHDAIEDHEEAATLGLASVLILAGVSVFGLLRYGGLARLRPRFRSSDADASTSHVYPRWFGLVLVNVVLASSAVLGYVGRLGGKIRHTEFHQSQAGSENDPEEGDGENEGGRRRGRNRGER